MKLIIDDLSFSYDRIDVLKGINLQVEPMVTVVIGPNGAGKSTLIKCVAGLLPAKGNILFDGNKIGAGYKEFHTRVMSYLPQTTSNYSTITVFEAVLMGMLNSLSLRVGDKELEQVDKVLKDLEIQDISHRQLNELSGGQQQMVYVAQAIIKNPKVILLDEPLNSLDIHHQFEILNLVRQLTFQKKMITIIAMHDLNMAAKYADCIVVMNKGQIHSYGSPSDVLTTEMIRKVYRVEADVAIDGKGIPFINPIQCLSSMSRCMV
jgi:iron complex transport system ATP-binding protein